MNQNEKPVKIHIDHLKQQAPNRPPGYLENCLRQGQFDGQWLFLQPKVYAALVAEYTPGQSKCASCGG